MVRHYRTEIPYHVVLHLSKRVEKGTATQIFTENVWEAIRMLERLQLL